jgi:hypothetical protein
MAAIIPRSTGSGKSLPSNLGSVAGTAHSTRFLPSSVLWRPLMSVFTVRARLASDAGLARAFLNLLKIDAAIWVKGFIDALARSNSLIERVAVDAANQTPFGKRMSFAVSREVAADSAVIHLNSAASPTTVGRLVIAVIVDAIQGHFWRWLAHIRYEILKLLPAFANPNASAAIAGKVLVIRIPASLTHRHPYRVRPRAGLSMRDLNHALSISKYINGGNIAV